MYVQCISPASSPYAQKVHYALAFTVFEEIQVVHRLYVLVFKQKTFLVSSPKWIYNHTLHTLNRTPKISALPGLPLVLVPPTLDAMWYELARLVGLPGFLQVARQPVACTSLNAGLMHTRYLKPSRRQGFGARMNTIVLV